MQFSIDRLYKTDLAKSIFRLDHCSTPWCVPRTFLDPATTRTLCDECFEVDDSATSTGLATHLCVCISFIAREIKLKFEKCTTEVTAAGNEDDNGKIEKTRAAETVSVPAPAAVVSCKCTFSSQSQNTNLLSDKPQQLKRPPAGRNTSQEANAWQRHLVSRHKLQLVARRSTSMQIAERRLGSKFVTVDASQELFPCGGTSVLHVANTSRTTAAKLTPIILFANQQYFSIKMFSGNVALKRVRQCKRVIICNNPDTIVTNQSNASTVHKENEKPKGKKNMTFKY